MLPFLWESSPDQDEPSFRQTRVLRGHSAAITGLAFSHQGDFLATTSSDSTIRLWDMRREPAPDIINVGTGQWVGKLAFAADGHTIAAICNQYEPSRTDARTTQVMFWDVVSGKQLTSLDTGRSLTSFAFCQNGRLATGGHNGEIDIWNWRERAHVKSLGKHTSCVFDLDFAPASNLLASASADKTARIWNLTTGREFRVLSQHDAPVKAVAFSPDERTIATGCDDRKVRTWNIASQEPPKVFKDHAAAVLSVEFSPDGQSLVSTSWDNTLRVWDSHDVDRKPKVLTGHSLWVSSVLLTSDGRTLFSASGDRTVKSWDVATWQQTFTFNGHTKGVQCLAVSPDGNIVASGSRDGAIRLWRAATTQ